MTVYPLTPFQERFFRQAQSLSLATLSDFVALYESDADFTDPFQTVRGHQAIEEVYRSMFLHLVEPRFTELKFATVAQPEDADTEEWAVAWQFEFRTKEAGGFIRIPGTSWLSVGRKSGLIARHIDHWDASELMAGYPVLSWAIRGIKRRIAKAGHVIETS
ncbi:MAG: hypothetical protein RLY67_454 [Pseudomonadota bacterium]